MSIDTEHFRARLLDERRRVTEAIEHLRRENPGSLSDETGELNPGFDQHPGDAAVELERNQDGAIGHQLEHLSDWVAGQEPALDLGDAHCQEDPGDVQAQ